MTPYKELPVLEQLAILCGAAEQAGVPCSLVSEFQENIRTWVISAQTREAYLLETMVAPNPGMK